MLVYYLSDGRKQREEFDHDYDGMADVKSYYEQGQLVRQELDVNYDGKPDLVQHFEGGRIVRTEKLWATGEAVGDGPPRSASEKGPADAVTVPGSSGSGASTAASTSPTVATTPADGAPLRPSETTPRTITPQPPPPDSRP